MQQVNTPCFWARDEGSTNAYLTTQPYQVIHTQPPFAFKRYLFNQKSINIFPFEIDTKHELVYKDHVNVDKVCFSLYWR